MFTNFKLRNRMLLGYSIPLVFLIGLGGIAYSSANQVYAAFKQENLSQKALLSTNKMAVAASKMERAVRGYLVNKDESFLQTYEKGLIVFEEQAAAANKIIENAEQKERLQSIIRLGEKYDSVQRRLINFVKQGKTSLAVKEFSKYEGRDLVQEIEEVNGEFYEKETAILNAATSHADDAIKFLLLAALLGTLLPVALSIAAALLMSSGIAKKINQAVTAIASSASEIAATTEQQERTASHQATSVHQTTTTMDELGASSRTSAEQAEAAAAGASQVLALVDGTSLTDRGGMNVGANLRDKVGDIAEQILRLSEQTHQIGTISTLVSELANQTNMLALNAAVEAVRAGEHGKGFSVVATEIRKLADESKKSAERINGLVRDIQNATNSTIMATDEGRKTVDTVVASVNQIATNTQQISLTAKQQAVAIQQVVEAMNSINMNAAQTASGISQTKVGTQKLNEAAQHLKAVV